MLSWLELRVSINTTFLQERASELTMLTLRAACGYLLVACLWGCTNPFIKHAQQSTATKESKDDAISKIERKESFKEMLWNLKTSFSNMRVMIPFVLNQMGSAVFYLMLSTEPVSIVSPVCNSLTFLFTAMTSYIVFKESVRYPWFLVVGIIFILCGTVLCL